MNYRHAYHAGNFADVLKHAALVLCLRAYQQKPAPYCFIDTHAGAGQYNLASVEAQKTLEYQAGIGALATAGATLPAVLAPYWALVQAAQPAGWQPGQVLGCYEGSGLLAARLARGDDRTVLCELHPEDATTLAQQARRWRGVQVHMGDGYSHLIGALPVPGGRAVVLIDPPFEQPTEWDSLSQALTRSLRRAPHTTFLVWYPVKDEAPVAALLADLAALELGGGALELRLTLPPTAVKPRAHEASHRTPTLRQTGLLLINPPYSAWADLVALPQALSTVLGGAGTATWQVAAR